MKFFNSLFKGNPSKKKSKEDQEHEQSKFMPKVKIAIEERFIINFIDNGGKFLYSENYNELNKNLDLILKENSWVKEDLLITNNKIKSNYKLPNSIKINQENSKCFVTNCENLIADDGSILISSNQIEEKKLSNIHIYGVAGRSLCGLILASKNLGLNWKFTGVTVNYDMPLDDYIFRHNNDIKEALDLPITFYEKDLNVLDQYVGEGYGIVTQEVILNNAELNCKDQLQKIDIPTNFTANTIKKSLYIQFIL